jgi:hypothetical protein
MRRLPTASLAFLLVAAPLFGGDAKDCLDLTAKVDNDVSSPSGVRVSITGRNHCQEEIDGSRSSFKVKALGSGSAVIATQRGRLGGTIAPGGRAETKVFVVCDPDRVRSVTVEAN